MTQHAWLPCSHHSSPGAGAGAGGHVGLFSNTGIILNNSVGNSKINNAALRTYYKPESKILVPSYHIIVAVG